MYLKIESKGLDRLVLQLEQVQRSMLPAIAAAMQEIGNDLAADLTQAAPYGGGTSSPAGDEAGPLNDSFVSETLLQANRATLTVRTTQPTKLTFVRKGTGLYGPFHRRITPIPPTRALWWKGARHPVKSVSGQKPNDFVTPILHRTIPKARQKLSEAVKQQLRLKP